MSCPETIPPAGDHNDTNITIPVQWISPTKKDPIGHDDVGPVHAHFKSVCLQGNITLEVYQCIPARLS